MNCEVRKPELLAPAGDLEAGLTAFEFGADAVYAGLQRFNARERNENFSNDDLAALIAVARQRNRRVYVTLNTLIREPELPEVAAMLQDVAALKPDAVIVQDLGVLRLIRTCFPELSIHASTQMGTHNSAAVNWLADHGVERVILQRQIPLPELRQIVENSSVEVEAFVHGALCCCLSGACLFSSWMGGWSGNRGKCKQPCRRRYFSEKGNGFFFSTNDLYGLDLLDALADAGVASLKIEGRLRKADYVEHVVKAYRMILDAPRAERAGLLGEARAELSQALGRKWSHGYLVEDEWSDVVDPESPGVSGMLCARVVRTATDRFTLKASRRLHFGDRIRIQSPTGDDGPALTVTMMHLNGAEVKTARRGDEVEIRFDRALEVPRDGLVYRIGVAARPRELRAELPVAPVHAVDLRVVVASDGFEVDVPGVGVWRRAENIPEACKRAVTADLVEAEFRKSLLDSLVAGVVDVQIEGERFLSQRDLRLARRELWEWIESRVDAMADRSEVEAAVEARAASMDAALNEPVAKAGSALTTVVRLPKNQDNPVRDALTARMIDEVDAATDEVILPDFCPEPGLPDLRRRIVRLIDRGFKRWRVTSLYALELLAPFEGLTVTASFLLPVANSLALLELLDTGVFRAMAWPELDREALLALADRAGDRIEIFGYGRPPLLNSRVEPAVTGRINDARGNGFRIERDGELWRVFAEDVMELDVPSPVCRFIDLSHARIGESGGRNFNLDRDFA